MNTTNFLRVSCVAAGLLIGGTFSGHAVPVAFGGHYYEVISASGISWAAADAAANSSSYLGLPGHLVTLTSAAEDAFVFALLGAGSFEHWAGGFQNPAGETTATAGWTWVNGEGSFPGTTSVSPYANWRAGEPNDAGGPGREQFLGISGSSAWNDEASLGNIHGYVVEFQAAASVPDSGSTALLLFVALGAMTAARSGFRARFALVPAVTSSRTRL